jgi:hypothetical protein
LLFIFRVKEVNINKRLPYVLTKEQQTAIQVIQDQINRFQQWKEEQDSAEEDPEDKEVKDNGSVKEDREEEDRGKDKNKGFKDRLSDKEIRRM